MSEGIRKCEGGFYLTVWKGTEYCAKFNAAAGQWFVATRRLALGRSCGGGKYYEKLEDCKPFAALPILQKIGAL